MTSVGWAGAALSGLALVAVTTMVFLLFGVLDAHYRSLGDIFNPAASGAAGTLSLAGGAEGVTLSIVIVAVMFGIQGVSSRYSPRIIGIFTRNVLNALVLGFALASILYTFLVRSEVTATYTPKLSVGAAVLLALLNFAILFPYVGYIFEVMRAETLVAGIMRRAGRQLRAAGRRPHNQAERDALMTSVAQVTDIAFGSIHLGDMPVCVMSIEVLGQFMAQDYLTVKKKFSAEWFKVGHAELPGASDQIIAGVSRAGTWFTYAVLSSFVDMVGLTPVHRKEAVHAIAVATRNIGLAAIEVSDSEVVELCMRFFNTYLRVSINRSAPTFASGIMNEYRRFAIGALEWRPDVAVESAAHLLRYGRHFDEAGMPSIFGAAAEDVADLAIEARARDRGPPRRRQHRGHRDRRHPGPAQQHRQATGGDGQRTGDVPGEVVVAERVPDQPGAGGRDGRYARAGHGLARQAGRLGLLLRGPSEPRAGPADRRHHHTGELVSVAAPAGLGAGGAPEQGRPGAHVPSPAADPAGHDSLRLHRPPRTGKSGRGLSGRPCRGAGADRAHGTQPGPARLPVPAQEPRRALALWRERATAQCGCSATSTCRLGRGAFT